MFCLRLAPYLLLVLLPQLSCPKILTLSLSQSLGLCLSYCIQRLLFDISICTSICHLSSITLYPSGPLQPMLYLSSSETTQFESILCMLAHLSPHQLIPHHFHLIISFHYLFSKDFAILMLEMTILCSMLILFLIQLNVSLSPPISNVCFYYLLKCLDNLFVAIASFLNDSHMSTGENKIVSSLSSNGQDSVVSRTGQ